MINGLIRLLGFSHFNHPWLFDPKTSIYAVILSVAWQWVGYHMMLFIAGIKTIPDEFYEAAKIDGASEWDIIRRIYLATAKTGS